MFLFRLIVNMKSSRREVGLRLLTGAVKEALLIFPTHLIYPLHRSRVVPAKSSHRAQLLLLSEKLRPHQVNLTFNLIL